MSRRTRTVAVALLALTLFAAAAAAAAGGVVSDKIRAGESISVGSGETVPHDLYVWSDVFFIWPNEWRGEVVIDGTVEGDLVAVSGTVMVNGTVEGDLVVGAGRVIVSGGGEVTGDIRAGAAEITVGGTVGEDLLAAAGRITIEDGGELGEDLIFAAGDVLIDGTVNGNVVGSASTYSVNGAVRGTEQVTRPDIDGQPARPIEPEPAEPVRLAGEALRQFLTVILFGAIGMWLIPGALRASEGALRRRPLASIGLGIGVLVGFVIQFIAVILLVILLAVALGSIAMDALAGFVVWAGAVDLMVTTLALVVAASFLVDAVVGLALGQLVARGWAQNRWQELGLLVIGAAIVVALTSVPEIGGLVKLSVIVLGLGAMTVAASEAWQRRHPPVAPSWTAQPPAPAGPPAAPGPPAPAGTPAPTGPTSG